MTATVVSMARGRAHTAKHTVENGAFEVTEELEKQVLLLRGQFVETRLAAAVGDLLLGETLLEFGVHPLLRSLEGLARRGAALLGPEFPGGDLLLLIVQGLVGAETAVGESVSSAICSAGRRGGGLRSRWTNLRVSLRLT